jgi:hypothetical protein
MSWDSIKENDSEFLKIEAGATVKVHILGETPEMRAEHFIEKKPSKCTGPDCQTCRDGVDKRTSWTISVFNLGTKRQQVMQQGKSVFRQILKIREMSEGSLAGVDFVISREGAGPKDTKYTVMAVPTQFKPEMLAAPADVPF